jgi:hypothetical protein
LTFRGVFSKLNVAKKLDGDCGEVVNASDCGSDTRGFDSHQSPHLILGYGQEVKASDFDSEIGSSNLPSPAIFFDPLAQQEEHLTFNQRVGRSNRLRVTIAFFVRVWRNWQTR